MAIQSSKHKGECVISLSSDPIPTSRLGRRSCRNRTDAWRCPPAHVRRGLGPTHISNGPMSVLYEASLDRSFPMWDPPPPNPLCRPFSSRLRPVRVAAARHVSLPRWSIRESSDLEKIMRSGRPFSLVDDMSPHTNAPTLFG